MSNALYANGRQKILEGSIAWLTDTIKIALIDTSHYTVNLTTDTWLSDISGTAIVSTSAALASKTSTAGVANAASATFSLVTGPVCSAVVVYKSTGTSSTSPLVAYIDTATYLPVTPVGGNIVVKWQVTSPNIFQL